MYRYHGLAAAREKAARFGYQGALYAWEAAEGGEEATPEFVTGAVGGCERIGGIGVDHDLRDAVSIAHIEEDHPPVITAAMYPAAERDLLIYQGFVQLAAIMAAHVKSCSVALLK